MLNVGWEIGLYADQGMGVSGSGFVRCKRGASLRPRKRCGGGPLIRDNELTGEVLKSTVSNTG